MTRKQYIRNMNSLVLAIYNHPDSTELRNKKNAVGIAFKSVNAKAKTVPSKFGSYQAAWDSIKWTREHFMGDM